MSIPNWLKYVGSVAAVIVSVGGAFAVLGIESPRPAWASEIRLLQKQIFELDNIITSQQLDDTMLRIYQNLREQQLYINDNDPIPDFLLLEQTELESRKRELEDRLEAIQELDR